MNIKNIKQYFSQLFTPLEPVAVCVECEDRRGAQSYRNYDAAYRSLGR